MSRKRSRSKSDKRAIPFWVWLLALLCSWVIFSSLWHRSPMQAIKDGIRYLRGQELLYQSPAEHELEKQALADSLQTLEAKLADLQNRNPYRKALVNTEANSLNLRASSDLASEVVIKIPDSSIVEVLYFDEEILVLDGEPGKWCKVRYADKEGWVWGNYVQLLD